MHYITLDTNTWIYLANGTEPVRILNYIHKEVVKGNIIILLPQVIIKEWNKNKEFAVKKGGLKHYKDVNEALEKIAKLLGNNPKDEIFSFLIPKEAEKEDLKELIKKFKTKRKEVETAIEGNIDIIDFLFSYNTTIVIEIKPEILLKSAEFALEKKAPFHNRNSFADAVIYFSFIDYVITNGIEDAWFITYNTVDFCEKNTKDKNIHSDLLPFLIKSKSKFYTIVGAAINTIEKDIITQEEINYIQRKQKEAERLIYYCEPCEEYINRFNEVYLNIIDLIDERSNVEVSDPNQLIFDYASPHNSNQPQIMYTSIEVGNCDWCNTEHFKCSKCQTLNAIYDGEYDEEKVCEGCGLVYIINTSEDYENLGKNYTYRIPNNSPNCENCGEEFEAESNGNNICQKCEEGYLNS